MMEGQQGFCREIFWAAACRFAATCSKMGVQDAKRKRTFPSLTPGPWTGTITLTEEELVAIVSNSKWGKTKTLIGELRNRLDAALAAKDQSSEEAKLPLQ